MNFWKKADIPFELTKENVGIRITRICRIINTRAKISYYRALRWSFIFLFFIFYKQDALNGANKVSEYCVSNPMSVLSELFFTA